MESLDHADSVFITLTYDDENLPSEGQTPQAQKKPVQLFLKRLRAALPQKLRYFICSEYGDRTNRLHFHGIIFGASMFDAKAIDEAWGLGWTLTGECNQKTINYVTKYVTKGDSRAEKESGRPTWAIMSRNKGIGHNTIQMAGKELLSQDAVAKQVQLGDVPANIRQGAKLRPIGRYLTSTLRVAVGHASGNRPDSKRRQMVDMERDLIAYIGGPAQARVHNEQVSKQSELDALAKIRIQKSKGKL